MDYVYLLSHLDNDNTAINHSVNSVRKFADPDRIYVVGRDPHIDGVTHIYYPQPNYPNREANMIAPTMYSFTQGISDPFILMCDDIFLLKPFTPTMYYKYDLSLAGSQDDYARMCQETGVALKEMGFLTNNYETHTPVTIHHKWYRVAYSTVDWENSSIGFARFSVYGNMFWDKLGQKLCPYEDSKSVYIANKVGDSTTREELIERLSGLEIISPPHETPEILSKYLDKLCPPNENRTRAIGLTSQRPTIKR